MRNFIPFAGAICLAAMPLSAQILYETPGHAYIQDFDLLPRIKTADWEDGKTLQGWHALYAKNEQIPETIAARTGKSTLGGLASLGISEKDANRALGNTPGIVTGNTVLTARFQNKTGKTLTRITIGYTGQLWRIVGGGPKELLVSWHVNTPESQEDWTAIPELVFSAPVQEPANTELDGTLPENSEVLSTTITDISWPPDESLYIRFFQVNDVRNKVFAIDDFTFNAEP